MTNAIRKIDAPRARQLAALPWRIGEDNVREVLLITSRTNGRWMLPKGWPMEGHTNGQAAALEAYEEAGVEGYLGDAPIGSYAYRKLLEDGTSKPSRAVIYSLRVDKQHRRWPESSERRRKWFTVDHAARKVFEPDLRRFLINLAAGRIVLPAG